MFLRRKRKSRPPPRNVGELVAPYSTPAVQLVLAEGSECHSFFGGSPLVGSDIEWPCKDGRPLSLLASLHLSSLNTALRFDWLPGDGYLLFFFDVEAQPWGFDPNDRGGWSVIHTPAGTDVLNPPPAANVLPRRGLEYRRIRSLPSAERPEIRSLGFNARESDQLCELVESSYGGAAAHQLGGFPDPIQGDQMELECQLAANGVNCGDPSGFQSAEARRLADGASDWVLLLQLASDDDLDFMWGDLGQLYFWIREPDARAGRFDRAWVILQCT